MTRGDVAEVAESNVCDVRRMGFGGFHPKSMTHIERDENQTVFLDSHETASL